MASFFFLVLITELIDLSTVFSTFGMRLLGKTTVKPTGKGALKLGGVFMRKLAAARVSYLDDFLVSYRVYMMVGHVISRYLKVHFILIKYTSHSRSQTLRVRYPFQSTSRPISHRNGWSFRVYIIPLRNFVPWSSRSVTTTGVNSRRAESRQHGILWWYHKNKCRAMRGNRSDLAPVRKSPGVM